MNEIFGWFGLGPADQLARRPRLGVQVAVVVGVWSGMPQTTITLLAGLQSVSDELHEAAAVDGASTFRRFLHVTLPGAASRSSWRSRRSTSSGTSTRSPCSTCSPTASRAHDLPLLFAYNEAFRNGNWGYAAAMGNVMVVVVGIFLILYLWGNRKADGDTMIRTGASKVTRPLQYVAPRWRTWSSSGSRCSACSRPRSRRREEIRDRSTCCPSGPEWQNFRDAIDETRMWTPARNSAQVAIVTMLLTIVISLPAAYALARYKTKFRGVATGWILLSQVFPFILVIIPLFLILRKLPIVDWNWSTPTRADRGVHGLVAAVRAVDAARLRRRHPARPRGGGARWTAPAGCGRCAASSCRCCARASSPPRCSRSSRRGTSSSSPSC